MTEKEPSSSSQKPPSLLGLLRNLAASLGTFLSDFSHSPQHSDNPSQPKGRTNEISDVRINPGPGPIRVVIDSVPPSDAEKAEKNKKRRRKTISFYAELVVGLFIVAYTIVSICQWRAAQHANEIASGSVNNADRNFRTDERAWVAVSEISTDFGKDGNWTVRLVFKNTGKTPAKNFVLKATGEPVAKSQKPTSKEDVLPGHGVIAPEGVFHSNLNISGQYDWKSVDLVIHGRIDYDSVFGNGHWTQFCYYFVPDNKTGKGGFAPCETGNDTDSSPP